MRRRMLAQGNALGFRINRLLCAQNGRRNPPLFQGGRRYLGTIPGALPRAGILRAVGATTRLRLHWEKTATKRFLRISDEQDIPEAKRRHESKYNPSPLGYQAPSAERLPVKNEIWFR